MHDLDISIRMMWLDAREAEYRANARRHRADGAALVVVAVGILASLIVPMPFWTRLIAAVVGCGGVSWINARLDATRAALDRYDARWTGVGAGMPPRTVRS